MHPLHLWRVHENLAERPRQRHEGKLVRLDLYRDGRLLLAIGREEVSALARLDDLPEGAQDGIVVEAGYRFERRLDLLDDATFAPLAVFYSWFEARGEKLGEECCERGIAAKRSPHVVERVGHLRLPEIAGDCAKQRRSPPRQRGEKNQRVEAVIVRLVVPDREDRIVQPPCHAGVECLAVGPHQRHVVAVEQQAIRPRNAVGAFVDDGKAEVFKQRHTPRQRDRIAKVMEAHHHPRYRGPAEEAHFDVVGRQPLGDVDIAKRVISREARAIVRPKRSGKVAQNPGHPLRRIGGVQRLQKIVIEGPDDVADLCFDLVLRRVWPLPRIAPNDELHARQVRHREIWEES